MKLELLLEVLGLKEVRRAGWVRRGVADAESVADHSWGISWLVLVLLPAELDRERALAYAVLHDLAEVRVGDLIPADGVPEAEKHRREVAAIGVLLADHPELRATWEAYEAQADPEAVFVRQLDRLEMALQAIRYAEEPGFSPREFLESAAPVVDHPTLRPILEALFQKLGDIRR